MKIIHLQENTFIIFLNQKLSAIDFHDREKLEPYFKELFLKLKHYYNFKIEGLYLVDVYWDKNYGIVLEVNKEEYEYIDFFDREIDMRLEIKEEEFFYETSDILGIPHSILEKMNIYRDHEKIYLFPKTELDFETMGRLLEYTECHYRENGEHFKKERNLLQIN